MRLVVQQQYYYTIPGIDPFTGSSTHVAHHLDGRKQLSKDRFPRVDYLRTPDSTMVEESMDRISLYFCSAAQSVRTCA